jgi:molybdate transport system permease protein
MWEISPTEATAAALSLRVAAESVLIGLPAAIVLALLLARRPWRGRVLLDTLIHLPLVLPPVVVGYLLLTALGARSALGRWLYSELGVRLPFTVHGAALATAVMTLPLLVRSIRLSREQVGEDLLEAARLLGAGPLDRFASVTLPLIGPGLVAGVVMAFAASLGEFGAVITFAGNVPGETQTLPLALYSALESVDGEASAFRIALFSIGLGATGLVLAEVLSRRLARRFGR